MKKRRLRAVYFAAGANIFPSSHLYLNNNIQVEFFQGFLITNTIINMRIYIRRGLCKLTILVKKLF